MKTISLFVAGALAGMAGAQTAVYDTSILRTGNAWTYEYSYAPAFNQTNDPHGYSGTRRFEITQRFQAGDSLVFRVAFRDSILRRSRVANYYDSTVTITDSNTTFVLRQNAYAPYVPFFAKGQAFTGAESKVVYSGDTVKHLEQSYPGQSCIGTAWENIEGIGRVYDFDRISCGNTHTSTEFRLIRFNGAAFDTAQVSPVALGASLARKLPEGAARILLHRGRLTYERDGKAFDLRGQRVPDRP